MDVITDLYLIVEIWYTFEKGYEDNRIVNVGFLVFSQIFERIFTFQLLKQLFIQKYMTHDGISETKIGFFNNFKLFMITICYGDYIYIFRFQDYKYFWVNWRKKQVVELFFEHIVFLLFGLHVNFQ